MKEVLYLSVAIFAEVIATSSLKASEELTKLWPTVIMCAAYLVAFYFMMLVIRTWPLGVTYAIWSGVGLVAITAVAAIKYGEMPDVPAIIGIGLILAGVVVIRMFSKMKAH